MNVVILAAGKGTRMKSDLPKVLHRVAGRPMIEHVVQRALELGASRTIVVVGHGAELVKSALAAYAVVYVDQLEQRGTGHAVMQALGAIAHAEPTLVLYGDVPLTSLATLRALVAAANTHTLPVLTVDMADAAKYGRIVRDASGQIARIVEFKDANAEELKISETNTGMMVLPALAPARWLPKLTPNNAQGELYLTDVVALARAEGMASLPVSAANEAEVEGVNSKVELARVERYFQAQQAHSLLEQGVEIADPARFDVRGTLVCGRDVSIDVNCVFEGKVSLGDGVRVGAGCVLKDVEVAAGAVLKPYTVADGEGKVIRIGAGAQVGPFARLRAGANLGVNSHIGNFVEVKNSRFGPGSKANHLAYVGDSVVGERVNIGAGVITANYDGAAKHTTTIEDDVHIGSNSVLVAPVTVGRGGTVGAGSTITKNTPPEQLTVARGKQVSLSDWQRPKKQA
jgi:bifunctional UDP-N-acetylglucosamine pyrophosphorylase / glucosamine-1-phosphate N-acetyltransferase